MITLWGVSSKVECVNRCWHLAVDVDFNQPLKEFSYKSIVSQLHDFPKIDILHFLGGGYINDVFFKKCPPYSYCINHKTVDGLQIVCNWGKLSSFQGNKYGCR